MKASRTPDGQKAFALVITLALLALMVLALYALSVLTRVGGQVATTGVYQMQARQNALLGLHSALSQLQQFAGPDTSLTGSADIVPSSRDANSRWTGVWLAGNSTPHWLVSGGVDPAVYSPTISFDTNRKVLTADPNDIVLVNSGSTNTASTKYSAGDGVIAPRVPIPNFDASGGQFTCGNYAFWVGDEGIKLSAALIQGALPPPPVAPSHSVSRITSDTWTPDAPKILKAISYEQLINTGQETPASVRTSLRSSFHGLGLLHTRYTDYPSQRAGMINVNSAGARLWRGVLLTFNPSIPTTQLNNFVAAMSNRAALWAPSGSDKIANGPFQTVAGFLVSNPQVTDAIVASSSSLPVFQDTMQPWFTVRSDTFRIRAYGDALNPVAEPGLTAGKIESTAYCEAIVQRVKDSENADGRFVITYFRWLGPDDI